ncbi:MAG: DUF4174 domain-containing protein [Pseudomonadota bacterium]
MTQTKRAIFAVILGLCTGQSAISQDIATASESTTELPQEAVDPLAPRDATETNLNDFLWLNRPIIVFADTAADPRFQEQMALLEERSGPLLDRDAVIIFDTDPDAGSAIRTELRPRGFALVVLTKDGAVGFRSPSPRDVREITRRIDNFSIRQEELRTGG